MIKISKKIKKLFSNKEIARELDAYIGLNYQGTESTPVLQEAKIRKPLMAARKADTAFEYQDFSVGMAPMASMTAPLMAPLSLDEKEDVCEEETVFSDEEYSDLQDGLEERMEHLSDSFAEYLMYLIERKNLKPVQVYKAALVDKKVFSKIKNNPDYHPQKLTALCLCVGAKMNLDETVDLLARAGYALSPCDKTDIIFSYFIEKGYYDMYEIDIQLEGHDLPCIIA